MEAQYDLALIDHARLGVGLQAVRPGTTDTDFALFASARQARLLAPDAALEARRTVVQTSAAHAIMREFSYPTEAACGTFLDTTR